jgi:hypothetical protein
MGEKAEGTLREESANTTSKGGLHLPVGVLGKF